MEGPGRLVGLPKQKIVAHPGIFRDRWDGELGAAAQLVNFFAVDPMSCFGDMATDGITNISRIK